MKITRWAVLLLALLLIPAGSLSETTIVKLTCTGDLMPGSNDKVSAQEYAFQRYIEKYGYGYPLEKMQGLLANDDITLVNFECVLNDTAAPSASRFRFRGPTDYAQILVDGSVEVANLANNHSGDYGKEGYLSTKAALEGAGIKLCGTTEFGNEACFVDVKGVRIGFVGVFPLWNKDHPQDLEKAFQYLKDNDCDVIVASLHAGEEYRGYHGNMQESYGNRLRGLGAHIIVGNHPHVPEAIRVTNGVTQLYSLGNFSFGGNTGVDEEIHCLQSMVAQFDLYFEDGRYIGHQLTMWPIHISGVTPENNYQPVLVDGEDAQKVMRRVAKDSDGYVTPLKPFVDGVGSVQDFVPWTK